MEVLLGGSRGGDRMNPRVSCMGPATPDLSSSEQRVVSTFPGGIASGSKRKLYPIFAVPLYNLLIPSTF